MNVPVLLAADYANVEQSGKLNVMGVFTEIYASSFPARHPEMHLVAKLIASPAEFGTTRRLTIKLLNEDATEEVVNWSRDIQVPIGTGGKVEINQILKLQDVVFPTPGVYSFSVLIDNDEKASLPIAVTQR